MAFSSHTLSSIGTQEIPVQQCNHIPYVFARKTRNIRPEIHSTSATTMNGSIHILIPSFTSFEMTEVTEIEKRISFESFTLIFNSDSGTLISFVLIVFLYWSDIFWCPIKPYLDGG